ncbi:hypothetical protein SDC9_182659 [bioreactor metagenome]|uniref:Uncharacterized protein n=1 Tax=bioreactor metagenome TaxID=1076179 RepID=A0A645HGC1_9ZZZZ
MLFHLAYATSVCNHRLKIYNLVLLSFYHFEQLRLLAKLSAKYADKHHKFVHLVSIIVLQVLHILPRLSCSDIQDLLRQTFSCYSKVPKSLYDKVAHNFSHQSHTFHSFPSQVPFLVHQYDLSNQLIGHVKRKSSTKVDFSSLKYPLYPH